MPETVVERLVDNQVNGLRLLADALTDNNAEQVAAALTVIYHNGRADYADLVRAMRGENTRLFGRIYERMEVLDGMIRALTDHQASILPAVREGFQGIQHDMERLRVDLTRGQP